MDIQLRDIKQRAKEVYLADNVNPEKFIDFGSPMMNEAFLGMDSGVFLIAGPPNFGKSTLVRMLYQQVILNNPDRCVLDLSLDDDFKERTRFAVASIAKIPINWVKLPTNAPEEAKVARNAAYKSWSETIAPRLQVVDETDFDCKARKLSVIRAVIETWVGSLQTGIKPFIVIDGFHNIDVDELRSTDENVLQKHLSTELKSIAASTGSIIMATSHIQKHNVKRGLDHDAVKGSGQTGYDAKVIANIYSDFKANRGNAEVYFDTYLPHTPDIRVRQPVIELDIRKNKAGSFSDVIFFRHYPEYSYVEEAPMNYQKLWKQTIYGEAPAAR